MATLNRSLRVAGVLAVGLVLSARGEARPLDAVEADRARISAHLEQVERELRAADVSELTPEQLAERRRNIERLRAYRLRGEFPHNTRHRGERVPYFIDANGRACAVGALMIESGHVALADRISASENYARLPDMTTPGIAEWVKQSGLSAAECARIQPSYCDDSICEADAPPVCGASGTSYACLRVLDECSNDTFAYEGECVDGGPADAGPVVIPQESPEESSDESCALAPAGGAKSSAVLFALACAGLLFRFRRKRG